MVRSFLFLFFLLLCTPCPAAETYVVSCDTIVGMAILEAPGDTWDITTSDGFYYTLFIGVAPDFIREHQEIMTRSIAFRPYENTGTLQVSYHDITLIASGKTLTSDTDLGTQYGDSGISITRKNRNDAFAIAEAICPAKAPGDVIYLTTPGPYF